MTDVEGDRFQGPLPAVVDHIIVGAGSAGAVLAARLSADPDRTVLLLEAGEVIDEDVARVPGMASTLWAGASAYENLTVPQQGLAGRRVALATGRGLGGGSSVNGMGWFQAFPEDFEGWAAGGAAGWGWADMAPYLRLIEDHEFGAGAYHGAGGPMAVTTPYHLHPTTARFIAAGASLGWPVIPDLNGATREGIGLVQSNIRDGVRHSVLDGYLNPALGRENLTVRTATAVQRIALDGTRAVGVHCAQGEVRARRSVVVCAGALRTPHLLLLSGIGPRDQLGRHGIPVVADLPGVGANLHDHPLVPLAWPLTDASALRGGYYEDPAATYQMMRRGPLSAVGQAAAVLRSDPGLTVPDLQLVLALRGVDAGRDPLPTPVIISLVALLTPESRGSVTLRSGDPADLPLVDPGYLAEQSDHDRLRAGLRTALDLFAAPALASVTGPAVGVPEDRRDVDLDDYIRASAGPYWHAVGTARIGSDEMSVVGPDLNVHGIEGLQIADASVFPTIPRCNTQATVIALAERAAELIKQT
ncbi:GMC family oxidoreductase [Catenulispora pinisilvae]|uniref:GMC family oxidoreductase n=1 Tax=Catenulispora pinisilvae TaxID=2705253 RepID=UPI0018923F6E|nr:GMC family oxidoreductase N-terminal domain-containing protein [Catenulispora pinisilvae]